MRILLAVLLAGALSSCVPVLPGPWRVEAAAQAASPRDVTRAKRCAPPFGCKRPAKRERSRASPTMLAMIDAYAVNQGLSSALGRALVDVESGFDPRRRGRAGEWGLTQIKCQTARGLGFSGSCAGLADPATNLKWGLKHARRALDRGSIGFHQAGLHARRTSSRYVARINAAMR